MAVAIKTELESARAYAEGRGIRIDIKDEMIINDIKELVDIKLADEIKLLEWIKCPARLLFTFIIVISWLQIKRSAEPGKIPKTVV